MLYPIPLTAGKEEKQYFNGRGFIVMDAGGSTSLQLQLLSGPQQRADDFGVVGNKFSLFVPAPDPEFSGCILQSATDVTVTVAVVPYQVQALDGSNLTVSIASSSIPLQTREDAASAGNDRAAVAVNQLNTALVAASALRKAIRFRNVGASPAALFTSAAGAWANRCLVIAPDETWIESEGASLAWYAITDVAPNNAASVTAQEIFA